RLRGSAGRQARFDRLHIPVRQLVPRELVAPLGRLVEPELLSEVVVSRIIACARDRTQRSARVSLRRSTVAMAGTVFGNCPSTNCPMFQSLFAKLRPGANVVSRSFGSRMTSAPSELPAISVQRSASAP